MLGFEKEKVRGKWKTWLSIHRLKKIWDMRKGKYIRDLIIFLSYGRLSGLGGKYYVVFSKRRGGVWKRMVSTAPLSGGSAAC